MFVLRIWKWSKSWHLEVLVGWYWYQCWYRWSFTPIAGCVWNGLRPMFYQKNTTKNNQWRSSKCFLSFPFVSWGTLAVSLWTQVVVVVWWWCQSINLMCWWKKHQSAWKESVQIFGIIPFLCLSLCLRTSCVCFKEQALSPGLGEAEKWLSHSCQSPAGKDQSCCGEGVAEAQTSLKSRF